MKKLFVVLLLFMAVLRIDLKADEGMWMPLYIEQMILEDMQRLGLQLTAEEIYSTENPSISDAIVVFGRGCTGEMVSDKGLLLTNHHCGYGSIQSISTVENDYLSDGFWAASHDEELPVPGLTVRFMIDMERVTDEVLKDITPEMSEVDRRAKIRSNSQAITDAAREGNNYQAIVRAFFEGNEYYMVRYETFRDIRLVGTPPESIGKFGADTDNWMWPRHTGDFAFFRVYADSDNNPANYSTDNVPYKPRHFLPISINGVKKDDFTMILGNSGRTDRYLTSWGIDLAIEESNPTIVKIREEKLRIMKEGMDASEKTRLQYASKYAGVSNYWKYYIGQTRGLKRLNVAEKKKEIENDFRGWLAQNPEAEAEYGRALMLIEGAYETISHYNLARWYFTEAITRGSELLAYANRFNTLLQLLNADEKDEEAIEKEVKRLRNGIDGFFRNYDSGINQNMLASMLRMYYENVPAEQQPPDFRKQAEKYAPDFDRLAQRVFARSLFNDPEEVNKLLDRPRARSIERDPAYELIRTFVDWHHSLNTHTVQAYDDLQKGNRLFMAGLKAMHPERHFYSNANFTMRISYGTVQDYDPADAVHYNYYTTMSGIMEKEDPSTWEFTVPDKLKAIYENRDFGPYGNADGTMTVNFLTNHDITGGNSGSPVIDARGRLVGLAFDGNWEAMSGDIAYEAAVQRTINVDARYILLIVDKFAGAQNLIDEMVIVVDRSKPALPQSKQTNEAVEIGRSEPQTQSVR